MGKCVYVCACECVCTWVRVCTCVRACASLSRRVPTQPHHTPPSPEHSQKHPTPTAHTQSPSQSTSGIWGPSGTVTAGAHGAFLSPKNLEGCRRFGEIWVAPPVWDGESNEDRRSWRTQGRRGLQDGGTDGRRPGISVRDLPGRCRTCDIQTQRWEERESRHQKELEVYTQWSTLKRFRGQGRIAESTARGPGMSRRRRCRAHQHRPAPNDEEPQRESREDGGRATITGGAPGGSWPTGSREHTSFLRAV